MLGLGGNRIHWRQRDLERIAKRFNASASDLAGMVLRHQRGTAIPPEVEREAGSGKGITEATFIISTADVDRYGDTIAVGGWKLAAFRSNPVVQYAHDQGSLPIGHATKTWVEGGRLMATVKFDPDRFAQRVAAMVERRTLRATSVGFAPVEWDFTSDKSRPYGIDFKSQELLEFSIVNVPANPACLLVSTTSSEMKTYRDRVEAARALADPVRANVRQAEERLADLKRRFGT